MRRGTSLLVLLTTALLSACAGEEVRTVDRTSVAREQLAAAFPTPATSPVSSSGADSAAATDTPTTTAVEARVESRSAAAAPPVPAPPVPAPPAPVAPAEPAAPDGAPVALTVESRVDDVTTAELDAVVREVLVDPRGWTRAGFRFSFPAGAPYRVVLAEPAEVDRLCSPYRTSGQWSCQNGPVVALNAERWRSATSTWPSTVDDYRVMLVNHEVGHLLGQHHPEALCGPGGGPAALMGQQSKGLRGCDANGWPLDWEIACAARHEEPLAPGYEPSAEPGCGP